MIEIKLHRDILLDYFYVKLNLIIIKMLTDDNVFGCFSNFPNYKPIAYARNLSRKL